jgi:crotonobetainyl-CoA:carnitine CoA-transferase CaiB-like acyl-CoA transferase
MLCCGRKCAAGILAPPNQQLLIVDAVRGDASAGLRLVGQPVPLSRTPSKMVARPPEFGEQTNEVLAEFGFTRDPHFSLADRV